MSVHSRGTAKVPSEGPRRLTVSTPPYGLIFRIRNVSPRSGWKGCVI